MCVLLKLGDTHIGTYRKDSDRTFTSRHRLSVNVVIVLDSLVEVLAWVFEGRGEFWQIVFGERLTLDL